MKYKWELREAVGLLGFLLVLATLYIGLISTGPAKFFTAPNAQKLSLVQLNTWQPYQHNEIDYRDREHCLQLPSGRPDK